MTEKIPTPAEFLEAQKATEQQKRSAEQAARAAAEQRMLSQHDQALLKTADELAAQWFGLVQHGAKKEHVRFVVLAKVYGEYTNIPSIKRVTDAIEKAGWSHATVQIDLSKHGDFSKNPEGAIVEVDRMPGRGYHPQTVPSLTPAGAGGSPRFLIVKWVD